MGGGFCGAGTIGFSGITFACVKGELKYDGEIFCWWGYIKWLLWERGRRRRLCTKSSQMVMSELLLRLYIAGVVRKIRLKRVYIVLLTKTIVTYKIKIVTFCKTY
jgi:hypothetical protein